MSMLTRLAGQAEAARGDHIASDVEAAGRELEIEMVAILDLSTSPSSVPMASQCEAARTARAFPCRPIEPPSRLALDQQGERSLVLRLAGRSHAATPASSS